MLNKTHIAADAAALAALAENPKSAEYGAIGLERLNAAKADTAALQDWILGAANVAVLAQDAYDLKAATAAGGTTSAAISSLNLGASYPGIEVGGTLWSRIAGVRAALSEMRVAGPGLPYIFRAALTAQGVPFTLAIQLSNANSFGTLKQ